jgi:hypothetical protein
MWRKARNSVIAGLCGMTAHSILMLVHSKVGPLREFQPNEDIQRALSSIIGSEVHPALAWLLSFVNGALIWGLIFGQAYRFLPGRRPWQKGVFFGVCAWAVMGLLFFPLVDRGLFATNYGLGLAPALLMLIMMLSYSVTMSLIYHLLSGERTRIH